MKICCFFWLFSSGAPSSKTSVFACPPCVGFHIFSFFLKPGDPHDISYFTVYFATFHFFHFPKFGNQKQKISPKWLPEKTQKSTKNDEKTDHVFTPIFLTKKVAFWYPKWSQNAPPGLTKSPKMGSRRAPNRKNKKKQKTWKCWLWVKMWKKRGTPKTRFQGVIPTSGPWTRDLINGSWAPLGGRGV